VEQCHS